MFVENVCNKEYTGCSVFENCFIGKTVGLVTGSIRRKNE